MIRKIFDVHAHIYPDVIAAKAVSSIEHFYGVVTTYQNGTVAELEEICKRAGVERVVVHSVATTPKQVASINNYIAETAGKSEMFVPFATLHPAMTAEEIASEYERIKALGLCGIKLHPDCQKFSLDGEDASKLFDCLDGKLPVLVHTGDKRFNFSNPNRMISTAKKYPHIRFIAAHFGGWSEWEHAEEYIGLNNVWFDTSSSLAFLDPARAREIIYKLGVERFMFGSDFPMWNAVDETARLEALGLPEDVLDRIFYANAALFFNIK